MATTYVHRPTPVDAVLWDGDLAVVREFITGDTDAYRDSRSDVLWVTQKYRGATNVFPVALQHYLLRDRATGKLVGMSANEFIATYAMVAA